MKSDWLPELVLAGRFRVPCAALGSVAALAVIVIVGGAATHTPSSPGGKPVKRVANRSGRMAYRRLPLSFVANAGEVDHRVRYTAEGGGASFFFTRSEAMLVFAQGGHGLALQLRFRGANPRAVVTGADRSSGRVNYLLGSNPARWRRNLPTYGDLVYRQLWPGVELHFSGANGRLEYTFDVQPGVDPSRIRLGYRGQRQLTLATDGGLLIDTALGTLRDARPFSYQQIGGRRVAVASRFVLGRGGNYRFALGTYDRRYPLVIDPGLVYSTYLGGSAFDNGEGIAYDAVHGSTYVVGDTTSPDFPTTVGAFDTRLDGADDVTHDVFVTKLNGTGSALVYSTYLGGAGDDRGRGIALDDAGRPYLTGSTESRNFPTTTGAFQRSLNGPSDAFVTKLNAAGSALAYSTYLGGSSSDEGEGIAVDARDKAYVTGYSVSTDFPTSGSAFDTTANGGRDAFVTKLNRTGSALAYSTYLGGSADDEGRGIALDWSETAYVTGYSDSTDFPTTPGSFDTTANGDSDAFVTKLGGSALAYSTYLGGSGDDEGRGIAVDGITGNAYVTGNSGSPDFPTTHGAFDGTESGGSDAFATKLFATGGELAYSTYLGGSGSESGNAISLDGSGMVALTGYTSLGSRSSGDFPTTAGAYDRTLDGATDAFLSELNPRGTALEYSTYLGGSNNDVGQAVAIGYSGDAYLAGQTRSSDFPTSPGAFGTRYAGDTDAFVTQLRPVASPAESPPPPRTVQVDAAGRHAPAGCAQLGQLRRVFPRARAVGFRGRLGISFKRHARYPRFPGRCGGFETTYYLRNKTSPEMNIGVTLYKTADDLAAPLAEPAYGPVHTQRNGARVRTIRVPVRINHRDATQTGVVSAYRQILISSDSFSVGRTIPIAQQLRVHREIEAAVLAFTTRPPNGGHSRAGRSRPR